MQIQGGRVIPLRGRFTRVGMSADRAHHRSACSNKGKFTVEGFVPHEGRAKKIPNPNIQTTRTDILKIEDSVLKIEDL